jgi:hypothetical protein
MNASYCNCCSAAPNQKSAQQAPHSKNIAALMTRISLSKAWRKRTFLPTRPEVAFHLGYAALRRALISEIHHA